MTHRRTRPNEYNDFFYHVRSNTNRVRNMFCDLQNDFTPKSDLSRITVLNLCYSCPIESVWRPTRRKRFFELGVTQYFVFRVDRPSNAEIGDPAGYHRNGLFRVRWNGLFWDHRNVRNEKQGTEERRKRGAYPPRRTTLRKKWLLDGRNKGASKNRPDFQFETATGVYRVERKRARKSHVSPFRLEANTSRREKTFFRANRTSLANGGPCDLEKFK